MGKINPCLKKLFIFFNLLFAIVGGVLIALAMLSQSVYYEQTEIEGRTSGLITLYVVGGITMGMALLGAYGAYKEKKIPLIVFLSAMCVGCLGLLRVAIPLAVMRPQLDGVMEQKFRTLLPLDDSTPDVKAVAEKIQSTFQCCGLFSYEDWRQSLPESCSCQTQEEEEEGLCQKISYRRMLFSYSNGSTKVIYKQTCFPILMEYFSMLADITVGILFGFASLALLGAVMSTIMLLQLRASSSRPPVVYSIPTFSAQPPKYTELYNTAEK